MAGELIVVRAAGQAFALEVAAVREIRGWTTATPLPQAPAHVLGVIDLRGTVLPVFDLAARLGFPPSRPDATSVVVVAEARGRPVGLMVEAVSDLIGLPPAGAQPAPDVGAPEVGALVSGVLLTDQGVVSLLSIDAVVPRDAEIAEAA